MSNTLLNPSIISKAAAIQVVNNLVMGKLVNKQFKNEFAKVGNTISYRLPVRYEVVDGADITGVIRDTEEDSGTIVMNKRKVVPIQFLTQDLTLTIEKFSERYLKPAGITLANVLDADGCDLYKNIYNAAGTAGSPPSTLLDLLNARKVLNKFAVPMTGRNLVVDPEAESSLVNAFEGIFQPTIVNDIVKEASIGRKGGFDILLDQNVKVHTAGTPGGTPQVDGATQTGSTIAVKGLTTTTGDYHEGDIITLVGVNSVNPISKVDTGDLQQFVVTALATADGSGDIAALAISPEIITSGAYQTVTASAGDSADIVLVASHTANLAFQKDAIALVTANLELPKGAASAVTAQYQGISVRLIDGYDILTDYAITRMEILYGWKVTYPELAARLLG